MTGAVAAAGASLGGITRVVLGHGHPDHRGVAPYLGVPVLCHADNREDAEGDGGMRYFDFSKLKPYAKPVFPYLLRMWDGGPGPRSPPPSPRVTSRPASRRRPARRPRARAHRSVVGLRPPRSRQRLLLHPRPADRPPRPPARPPPGVQPRHRAGARIDPQARGDGAGRRVGRSRRPADRRRPRAARARGCYHVGHGQARPRARQGREAQRPRERRPFRRRATCSSCAAR